VLEVDEHGTLGVGADTHQRGQQGPAVVGQGSELVEADLGVEGPHPPVVNSVEPPGSVGARRVDHHLDAAQPHPHDHHHRHAGPGLVGLALRQ